MSYVAADSSSESLVLLAQLAVQHKKWVIQQAVHFLEEEVFKGGPLLAGPGVVRDYLRLQLAGEPNEVFAAIFLDSQRRALAFEPLSKGTVCQTVVHPRVVVQRALHHNAAAVIFAHQHPSGCVEPSFADRALTERLRTVLAELNITLLDHFVIGEGEPYSFADAGLL